MMKKINKVLSIVLSLSFILTASSVILPAAQAEEPYTVKMVYPYFVSEPADLMAVQNAINDYIATKTDVNAQLEFVPLAYTTLANQQTLTIAGGEQLDLMFVAGGISNMVSRGELIPLDELVDTYGPDIKAVLGDTLKSGTVNGSLYAVSNVKDWGDGSGFVFSKAMVDKYNIDTSAIKTFDDVEKAFETVQAGEPDMTMLASYGSYMSIGMYFSYFGTYDSLGDKLGVLINADKNLKVVDYYETEQYRDLVATLHDWYEKGYILRDVSTTTEMGATLLGAGKVFAYNTNIKPGIETEARNATGADVVVVPIVEGVKNSESCGGTASWGIGSTSKSPEIAMQLLNLLYKDTTIINLLDNGIEGTHYVKTGVPNVITFPEGITGSDSGYYPNSAYMFGNEYLSYVWEGTSPTLWDEMKKYNDARSESEAFGFIYDASSVKTQVTACTNVVSKYEKALGNGEANPDTTLPTFIEELKAAGIDDIIAEKQQQIDAWAQNNQ